MNIGQSIAIMGESGCGKSTILRYFTGLQTPTSGEICLAGKPITPQDTIPMVFQMPSSLEWYSVLKNVALPLLIKGTPKKIAEPFSALDSANRTKMQFFLADLYRKSEFQNLNPTIILVTHDAREAVFLASDIFIMGTNPGHVKEHIKVGFGERNTELRRSEEFLKLVAYVDAAVEN
jgi:NitT/TauT family transport system ATP-binding protein